MINYTILTMLIVGCCLLGLCAIMGDPKSRFEDGSFIGQGLMFIVAIALIAGGLLWKLVYSLVS